MSLTFPSSPALNDETTTGGRTYRWTGSAWELIGDAPAWTDITGKPTTFTPSAHAASHATGGADVINSVVVTPAQITANTNNYDLNAGDIFQISSDAARNITGLIAGSAGQALLLLNTGSFAITLKHESADSSAANRFLVPWAGDYVLAESGGGALLIYDATAARWRVV
jgi:hypothetical protein